MSNGSRLRVVLSGWAGVLLISSLFVASAWALPPGRAYELVSPPETGSVTPGTGALGPLDGLDCFETNLVTPDGKGIIFTSEQGALAGLQSNGVLNLYESRRGPEGWFTESKSASGAQTTDPLSGLCMSPDHQYSTLLTGEYPLDQGSLVIEGHRTSYVRSPDGSFTLVGQGPIGTDLAANVKWISAGGQHIIFTAVQRLVSQAPAGIGTASSYILEDKKINAVYDKTPLGLSVVSLLPSGLAPSSGSETTYYRGVSFDGSSVVFETVKGSGAAALYEHREGESTALIASGATTGTYKYAGISTDGRRVVYIKSPDPEHPYRGSIYEFDVESRTVAPVTLANDAAVVNVSADGSTVYFTSSEAIAGSGENPLGDAAVPGSPNIYVWDAATGDVHFVATVLPEDVEKPVNAAESLTEWTRAVAGPQQEPQRGRLNDPSRTTPDGSVFIFEVAANVTGYDSGGHHQIYRYDRVTDELACISCPEGPAGSDAFLERRLVGSIFALNSLARVDNVTADGSAAFFMSGDRLVPEDHNDAVDVYEWKAGRLSLISGGGGEAPSILYGMSPDGDDVFFLTIDRLVPQDPSSVLSLYDARLGGTTPPPPPPPQCATADRCATSSASPPAPPALGSDSFMGPGNRTSVRPKPCRRAHSKHRRKKRCHRAHAKRGTR